MSRALSDSDEGKQKLGLLKFCSPSPTSWTEITGARTEHVCSIRLHLFLTSYYKRRSSRNYTLKPVNKIINCHVAPACDDHMTDLDNFWGKFYQREFTRPSSDSDYQSCLKSNRKILTILIVGELFANLTYLYSVTHSRLNLHCLSDDSWYSQDAYVSAVRMKCMHLKSAEYLAFKGRSCQGRCRTAGGHIRPHAIKNLGDQLLDYIEGEIDWSSRSSKVE